MRDLLSIWKHPLDDVAIAGALDLSARQPLCTTIVTNDADLSALTIYNYENFINDPMPVSNETALTNMFSAMMGSPKGGTAFIPQLRFPITLTTPFSVPYQSNIVTTGGGGAVNGGTPGFFHFEITGSGAGVTFFSSSGPHTSGGVYFRGLAFKWLGATDGTETCILADTWNCQAIECNFYNCPIAFNAQGVSSGLVKCTINVDSYPVSGGGTAQTSLPIVILSGPQSFAIGPGQYFQKPQDSNNPGPAGLTAISIQNAEHFIVSNLHLSDWSYGINYAIGNNPSGVAGDVSFVECEAYLSPVVMQLANSSAHIYAQKFTSCQFSLATNTTTPNTTTNSLFIIDPAGSQNSNLEDIELNNCTIYQSNLHGLEIRGGQRIRVIGGQYSGNGPNGGAGIAITGSSGDVSIVGAELGAKYNNQTIVQSQNWALLVSGNPTGTVLVTGCQMGGYAPQSPVSVTGNPSKLIITNCAGYNDVNTTILSGTATISTSSFYAANASAFAGGTNYYGPSLVVFSVGATSSITFIVNGVSSTVPANSYVTLYVASPYDLMQFPAGRPVAFHWIGK